MASALASILRRCVLALGAVLLSMGGNPKAVAAQDTIPVRRYTTLNGLPHASVSALTQTPDGRLWVGTRAGLAVYDGRRFETVAVPDSLPGASILALAPMPDGSVWAALQGYGAVHVRNDRVVRVASRFRTPPGSIVARGDSVIAVTEEAVWMLPPEAERFERYGLRYDVKPPAMLDMHPRSGLGLLAVDVGPNGAIWVLDGRLGPGRFRLDGSVDFVSRSTHADSLWTSFEVCTDGRILLTRQGSHALFAHDPAGSVSNVLLRDLNGANYARCEGQTAYVTTSNGLERVDLRTNRRLSSLGPALGLPGRHPNDVLEDRTGTLWIGTRDGLLHLHAPTARHIRSVEGQSLRYVGPPMTGIDDELWVSTYGLGLVQLRPVRRRVRPDGRELWGGSIRSADGRAHAFADGYWYRRAPDPSSRWTRVGTTRGAVRGFVDSNGVGYFWHDDGLFRHNPTAPDAPQPMHRWTPEERGHYMMARSRGGRPLLRARGVLLRLEANGAGRVVRDTVARLPGFAEARGRHMTAARTGDVWMAFGTHGLLHLDADTEASRPHLHLDDTPPFNVTVSGDSLVLVSSRSGLYLLDARTDTTRRHLTSSEGLLNTNARDAILYGDSLYVSHPDGLTVLPRTGIFRTPTVPAATITGIAVNHRARSVHDTLMLAASERTVDVEFAAPYLRNPERVAFEYRLLPRDTTWHAAERSMLQFAALGPGRHRFEVRARIGASAGRSARLTVFIAPFFYETWWFWGLCVLGLLGLAGGTYRWRVWHLRRRKAELERSVVERTRELRAEKEKTEKQAQRLSELDEAKNRFFANLSHEFRTPLSLITEPLRGLLREGTASLPEALVERHRLMLRNAERLERLIDQLLDLSKSTAGRMTLQREPVDLVRVARKRVEAFVPQAEREDLSLHFRTDLDTVSASVDPDKIGKILSNLLSNAIKFTDPGGTVWLTVTHAPDSERHAHLVVKDTGAGISEEDLQRIFDRFEQVDGSTTRPEEGTGIGLSLTRDLVELHGGTIGVESEPGEGSAFTVRLPLGDVSGKETVEIPTERTDADLTGPDRKGASLPEPSGADPDDGASDDLPVLLVVDDHPDVCTFLQRELGGTYHVETATNGAEALDRMRSSPPDVVVSDVMMPEMDGFALCEAIKTDDELRSIPVLLLSARAEADDAVEGLDHGADDYVTKPFDVRELQQRVDRLLDVRQTLRSEYEQIVHIEEADLDVPDAEVEFMEAVLTAIQESIDDPDFTVDRLAEAVALSRRQLTRRLREATGETPAALIRRYRLEQAAAQLEDTENPRIADIAYAVGFRTVSHFSKSFKKHFGCPPSRYPDGA